MKIIEPDNELEYNDESKTWTKNGTYYETVGDSPVCITCLCGGEMEEHCVEYTCDSCERFAHILDM